MSSRVFPAFAGLATERDLAPSWDTQIDTTLNGRELRSTWQTYSRQLLKLTINFLRSANAYQEYQRLLGFWGRMGGEFDSFLIADPEDNAVTAHYFGIGDATTTVFQIQRTLVADVDLNTATARSYWPTLGDGYEPLSDLNGFPQVFKDTGSGPVLLTLGSDYTLSAFGVVTFTSAPAAHAKLSWTGAFYKRVRFDGEIQFSRIVGQVWKASFSLSVVKSTESFVAAAVPIPASLFLAVSSDTSQNFLISPDGASWAQVAPASPTKVWGPAIWNGVKFCVVAGSSAGVSATSPDAVTWTLGSLPAFGYNSMAWNGSVFCALDTAHVAVSADGLTWTAGSITSDNWSGIAWNGTRFVAIDNGSRTVATSPDGLTWTTHTLAMPSALGWQSIAWNGSVFCAVAGISANTTAATSPDGLTWTARTLPSSQKWTSIAWNGSVFCAISGGGSSVAATSPDGTTWTVQTLPSSASWIKVTWNGSRFLALALSGTAAATSPDGVTWTAQTLPLNYSTSDAAGHG